ncbi:HlyC/CorC family transporter [Candidatus Bealeia paramacronuclearis]|uniref:HlyC/CorC family transporter n=1 Tax=Candidatus Bealeia paramacronuclearis TaxID=1921001 RepID=A0ABZ2C116_9PROT|nr:HlyC/CorC family transporter [Candidatus Bealeia paramacronuclearis]
MSIISLILTFIIVLLLVGLSGVCAGSEAAILSASRIRLHHLAKKGNPRASIILEIQKSLGAFISALLFVNTWLNIAVTALVTSIMTEAFGPVGAVYVIPIMGFLITIYAEVLPKIYIYNDPERSVMALAPIFKPFYMIFSPITQFIDKIARLSLRLVGMNGASENQEDSSQEDLRGAIDLYGGPNVQTRHERAMLRSILDLADVEASEIMTHRKKMLMLDASLPPDQIVDKVLSAPYTRIPIWKDQMDNIIGVLHTKDLLRAVRSLKGDLTKFDITKIASPAWFIPATTTLFAQLEAFRERREHFALVVDEYGDLEGMLTLEDILEEIVGEIVDEHDVELPGVRLTPEGSYLVDGSVTIRDLNRLFDWNLSDEHASTIAGLILQETKQIPEVGQTFMIHGFRVDILRRQRHQITQVKLTPPIHTAE